MGWGMQGTLWFINLLRDHPLAGFGIGLLFAGLMFASKNLVIFLYARSAAKEEKRGS